MKKLLTLLLVVLIVFSFNSCASLSVYEIYDDVFDDIDKDIDDLNDLDDFLSGKNLFDDYYDYDDYYDDYDYKIDDNRENSPYKAITLTNGYDNLENNAQKTIYQDIYDSVYDVENEKTTDELFYLMEDVTYSGNDKITERDMAIAYAAFKNDNPQYFWLDTVANPDCSSDYYDECMYIYSYYSPNELENMMEAFDDAVDDFLESVPSGLSDLELELYVHDYIYDICEYDEYAAEIDYGDDDYADAFDSSNAYGVLVNGYAICQGYAEAYSYLLSLVGINSTTISSQDHIWNAVEMDGDWYYVDVTWDDTTQSMDYFNINEKVLLIDHEIAPHYSELTDDKIVGTDDKAAIWFNVYLPECTETEYNYYNYYD